MTTSITTFQKAKTGDLQFPTVSKFGIIDNVETGTYAERMSDEGHDWAGADLAAFDAFVSAGKADGWWQHMLLIAPLWGDAAHPSCVRVPLKVGGTTKGDYLSVASQTSGYENDHWAAMVPAGMVSGGKILGVRQPTGTIRVLAAPHTAYDIQQKPGFANAGVYHFGQTILLHPYAAPVDATLRISGGSGSPGWVEGSALNQSDIRASGENNRYNFSMGVTRSVDTADGNINYIASAHNPTRHRSIAGRLATIVLQSETPTPTPPVVNSGTGGTEGDGVRWTFLGHQAPVNGTPSQTNPDLRFRWYSLDDGSMEDATLESAYRASINTLFTALGKHF